MRKVVITAIKGGTGKTTVARLLALQAPDPARVVLIDMDPHPSSDAANKIALGDAGIGVVLMQPERLPLLPRALDAAAKHGATLAVLDTPPGHGPALSAAAAAADFVLIVSRPSAADLIRVPETLALIRAAGRRCALLFNFYPSDQRRREIGEAAALAVSFGVEIATATLGARVAFERIAAGEPLPPGPAADEASRLYRYMQNMIYS